MSFGIFKNAGSLLFSPKLSSTGVLAGAALSVFNPGIGAVVELLANAAFVVETSMPVGTPSADKKDMLKSIVNIAAPVSVQVLDQVAGTQIDPALIGPALDKQIDSIVTLFNDLGIFKHAPKPAAVPAPVVTK